MRMRYLRTRLILTSVGLLALVLGAVFLVVYTATDVSAKRQAQQHLQVGSNVFSNLLEARARELTSATEILVADFGFRQAVATGEFHIGAATGNERDPFIPDPGNGVGRIEQPDPSEGRPRADPSPAGNLGPLENPAIGQDRPITP